MQYNQEWQARQQGQRQAEQEANAFIEQGKTKSLHGEEWLSYLRTGKSSRSSGVGYVFDNEIKAYKKVHPKLEDWRSTLSDAEVREQEAKKEGDRQYRRKLYAKRRAWRESNKNEQRSWGTNEPGEQSGSRHPESEGTTPPGPEPRAQQGDRSQLPQQLRPTDSDTSQYASNVSSRQCSTLMHPPERLPQSESHFPAPQPLHPLLHLQRDNFGQTQPYCPPSQHSSYAPQTQASSLGQPPKLGRAYGNAATASTHTYQTMARPQSNPPSAQPQCQRSKHSPRTRQEEDEGPELPLKRHKLKKGPSNTGGSTSGRRNG